MPCASFAVPFLWSALGVPSARLPIDRFTFVSYVLPPLVGYFLVAVLVVTPQTRTVRITLCPLVALLALRAAFSMDMSLGKTERIFYDIQFRLSMLLMAIRALDLALTKGLLVRHLRPANSSPSTILDALDLVTNFRGHGWDWSYGLHIPLETRPTDRIAFVLCASLSVVAHALICGAFHRAVLTLVPAGVGSTPKGSTIFDDSLPFLLRYLRASIISAFASIATYAVVQLGYDLHVIPAVLVLGQDPAQWPPPFDSPWRATSLSDFWGKRWHQFLRRPFLVLGGIPLSCVLGRAGFVIGSFLASAVIHHIGLLIYNSQIEVWWMVVGFGMMAPGILAEHAFRRLTGRRVGGLGGWIWTMVWLFLWGNVIVEGFARAGVFNCAGTADSALPVHIPVEHLVAGFDAWLHSL